MRVSFYLTVTYLSLFSCLFMGTYSLVKNISSFKNWIFFVMSVVNAVYIYASGMAFTTNDYATFRFYTYLYFVALALYLILTTKFVLAMSGRKASNGLQFLFLFLIPGIMKTLIILFIEQSWHQEFISHLDRYRILPNIWSPWYYFTMACYTIYFVIPILILRQWHKETKRLREKKQAKILIITFVVTHALTVCESFLVSLLFRHFYSSLYTFYYLIWNTGVFVALFKYRLFTLTPDLVGVEIFNQVEDLVFLLNMEYLLDYANPKTKEYPYLIGREYLKTIMTKNGLNRKLERLASPESTAFTVKMNLSAESTSSLLVNARFSLVKDEYGDALGILVIARKITGIEKLKTIYGASDREIDIIKHVLTGSTNRQIAHDLNITERTVKAHLTSVYNKIGVDNKVRLFNVVMGIYNK